MKLLKYRKYNENKMWYKTTSEMLNFLKEKSKLNWVVVDCETTGLKGPKKEQLTQVSALVIEYNINSNSYKEIGEFDEKIKLTDETKSKYNDEGDKTKWVLGFNHYGSGNYKYKNEEDVTNAFYEWVEEYSPCLLVAQNAPFDMQMLSVRSNQRINNEVFDTKMLIQLYFLPLVKKLAETDSKYQDMVDTIGTSPRDNGLISSSMSKIGPALGINMSGYHDALTDCRITIEMFQKIIDFMEQNKGLDIQEYQIERIKTIRK